MTTNLTPTEIEELRIAIAEEMGWQQLTAYGGKVQWAGRWVEGNQQPVETAVGLPPYTTSIDSIREAAMERFKGEDATAFHVELFRSDNDCDYVWQLTALDWAIAFARTAKIWRYKV